MLQLAGPVVARSPSLRALSSPGVLGRLGAVETYRTDAEIVALIEQAAAAAGKPRCLFLSGLLPYANPGLEIDDPVYQKATFPFDTEAYQIAASRTSSTCGLWTENGWRYAGVDDPILYLPYADRVAKGQFAVVEEMRFAKQVGAWVDAIHWTPGSALPEPGDAVIIGCSSCPDYARGTANLEHEFTFGAWDTNAEGGTIFHGLDGGQPGFHVRTRAFVEVGGELWVGAVNAQGVAGLSYDGRPAVGRRVLGWTDVTRLPLVNNGNECITSTGAPLPGEAGGLLLPVALGVGAAALLALTPQGRALLAKVGRLF